MKAMGIESGERLEDSGAGNGDSANLTEPMPWRPYWRGLDLPESGSFVSHLEISEVPETRLLSVPEHGYFSPMDGDYEVSATFSRSTGLRRICRGVSFSMSAILPPQRGQSHPHEVLGSEFLGAVEGARGQGSSNCRQSGRSSRRRRFARKPQKRMRTKRRGKVWSRNRRRNSSAVTVISRFLPCGRSLSSGR